MGNSKYFEGVNIKARKAHLGLSKLIPYGKQNISIDDINAVVDVLKSDFLTQGEAVPLFEKKISSYCNSSHSIVLNSATSALHVACLSLGLGKGDILWTSPITFVASANAAIYCGAKVDFVDIDSKTYNMCPIDLEKRLIEANKKNCLPKILIPVHLSGQSCEMAKIKKLCDTYNISIIEDASHAIGGSYDDRKIGGCEFSDITVFSFHPVKIITTGEGGAATTNRKDLFEKMKLYRSHGITRNINDMTEASHGPWYYQQLKLGFNYRMTDIQAALGISQMNRLDSFINSRHRIASRYNKLFEEFPLKTPYQIESSYSSYHLYIIRLKLDDICLSHKEIFNKLRENNIGVNLHYIPVHIQPYYKKMGFKYGDFIESENYYSEAISLPIFPDLKVDDQDRVVETISKLVF